MDPTEGEILVTNTVSQYRLRLRQALFDFFGKISPKNPRSGKNEKKTQGNPHTYYWL